MQLTSAKSGPEMPKALVTLMTIWLAEARSMPLTSAKSGSEKPSKMLPNAANFGHVLPGEAAKSVSGGPTRSAKFRPGGR